MDKKIIVKMLKRNCEKFAPWDLEIYNFDGVYFDTIWKYTRYLKKCSKSKLLKELSLLTYWKKETKKEWGTEYYDTIAENLC